MSNLHDEERKMWLSQPEQDAWDRFALGVAGADALLARKVHREAWAAAMRSALPRGTA